MKIVKAAIGGRSSMKVLCVLVTALFLLSSLSASAAIYKCTDANGKTSFQQQPCPGEKATTSEIVKGSGGSAAMGGGWVMIGKRPSPVKDSHQEYYIDTSNIQNVNGLKAVMAKTLGIFPPSYAQSDTLETTRFVYYYFYDCAKKTYSPPIEASQLEDPLIGGSLEKLAKNAPQIAYEMWGEVYPMAAPNTVSVICGR